jgi:hypothetical protein
MVTVISPRDRHGHFSGGGFSVNPLSNLLNPEVF